MFVNAQKSCAEGVDLTNGQESLPAMYGRADLCASLAIWRTMMKRIKSHKRQGLTLLCIGLLACGSVLAEKPSRSGGGYEHKSGNDDMRSGSGSNNDGGHDNSNHKHRGHDRDDGNYSDRSHNDTMDHNDRNRSVYFDDHHRNRIHEYYSQQIHSGHCPPGLRKRNNGCLPPGQARRWQIGQRLPRDVVFYDLQPQILAYLDPPPPRHRYVRVASDILLIAVGTGMVLDAIDDLDRY